MFQKEAVIVRALHTKKRLASLSGKCPTHYSCPQSQVDMVEMIYRKSLRITSAVRSEMGVGSIVNLQSNDAAKIWSLPLFLHVIWNGPFQILVVMAMLVRIMSWAPAFAGLSVTIVMIPTSAIVSRALGRSRKILVKNTDARVKLATEIVTGIKAIKLYAWEMPYVERITELREQELKQIRKTQALSLVNSVVWLSGPVLVSLAAFGTYTYLGHSLTPAVAFPALALFNLLRFPIIMFPSQIQNIINAQISFGRIQKFMEAEEMHPESIRKPAMTADANVAVQLKDGVFSWDAEGKEPILKDLTVDIPRGGLVMVVGQVGSGKSSLLSAIMGEMRRKRGEVAVVGSMAYTAQDPWIQNSTLRSNILMGGDMRYDDYAAALQACALATDLEMLPAGDASEIGEKGINLSGGQKHRVALARAAYCAADIYLLDDPLSAVDAHVGRHLFDKCLCGLLADRCGRLAELACRFWGCYKAQHCHGMMGTATAWKQLKKYPTGIVRKLSRSVFKYCKPWVIWSAGSSLT